MSFARNRRRSTWPRRTWGGSRTSRSSVPASRIGSRPAEARFGSWKPCSPAIYSRNFLRSPSFVASGRSPRVAEVLHFGSGLAALPEETIAVLREEFPDAEPRELAPPSARIAPGDDVEILTGALTGITALISQVLPGEERVRILLDWLGDTREVELSSDTLRKSGRGN